VKNLTIISNNSGEDCIVLPFDNHNILFRNQHLRKVIRAFHAPINKNTETKRQIASGEIELEIVTVPL